MKMTYQFKKDLMKTLKDAFHYKRLMHEMHGRLVYGAGVEGGDTTAQDDYANSVNAYTEVLEKIVRMLTWALLISGDEVLNRDAFEKRFMASSRCVSPHTPLRKINIASTKLIN